jgi:NAD kinase
VSTALIPRAVTVTRPTEYEALIAEHGTRNQAAFVLEHQGLSIEKIEEQHKRFVDALNTVNAALPHAWRRIRLDRSDLDRFVFEKQDIVVALGQDGLVANVAKYLDGQSVIGVNPDSSLYEGVLVPHSPQGFAAVLKRVHERAAQYQERTMVQVQTDDGQRLLALNEIFLGHRSHQSARYELKLAEKQERQSSSGLIVSTGTGSTGWARSIHLERRSDLRLPGPDEQRLVFFVREAFPGSGFATEITEGELVTGSTLQITSMMNDGGVLFGDGIENDRISFAFGSTAIASVAQQRLRLAA